MTILRATLPAWLVLALAGSALAEIPDKEGPIRLVLNSRDELRPLELLGPKRQKTIEQVQQYLANDLDSLRKANQNSLSDPTLLRVLLPLETASDNLKNMDYKRPWGFGGAKAWKHDAWAYHQDWVDPFAIHIMAKYWECPESLTHPSDQDENRLKEQIWYAERASLLIHELVHGHGVPLNPTTTGNEENRARIDWGTKDPEAYAVQYVVLRLTVSKPVNELIALRTAQHKPGGPKVNVSNCRSMMLVDVLANLRKQDPPMIDVQGDLNDPDVYDKAIEAADALVKDLLDIELEPLVQAVEVRYSPDIPGWPPGENLPEEPPTTVEDQPDPDQPKADQEPKPGSDGDQTPPEEPKPHAKTPPDKSNTHKAVKRYNLPKGLAPAPAAGATTVQIEKWRNESYAKLDKMFQDDPERKANSEAFHKAVGWGEAQYLPCAQGRIPGKKSCGVTMHWWLGDRWSCSNCETCIMPSDHPKAKPFVQKSDQIRKKYDDWKDLVRKQADELRKAAKS